jgi:microcystin-dependent protein
MLFQVYTENGVKKIKYLTADTGTGAPVGSYLMLEKKSNPQGYLYCDGSIFDSSVYPALYQYLGTNVLPDFREFSPVGAEQNTTNVYDASTNPSGVIHDHDVYAEGESKDDQIQSHTHSQQRYSSGPDNIYATGPYGAVANISTSDVQGARTGTVTRGKRKAVFVYIKATSGLTENQQENVLNTINDNLSYSTTEHATGKKWIDEKPIYRRVFMCTTSLFFASANVWVNCTNYFSGMDSAFVSKIDSMVNSIPYLNKVTPLYYVLTSLNDDKTAIVMNSMTAGLTIDAPAGGRIILEYTKTTD